jgi:hypothetical protein
MPIRLTMSLAVLLSLALPGQTATLHVSKTGDGTDGLSWETAFHVPHAAIEIAAAIDFIFIAEGLYSMNELTITENVSVYGGFDSESFPIDLSHRNWREHPTQFDGGPVVLEANTILDGVTIGGLGFGDGVVVKGDCLISNCSIIGNDTSRDGAGIFAERGEVIVKNTLIANNIVNPPSPHVGGAIFSLGTSKLLLMNCTVVDNYSSGADGIHSFGPLRIVNSIIADESFFSGPTEVVYSSVPGGFDGEGNIDENPLFIRRSHDLDEIFNYCEECDYRLQPGSPCIDSGTITETLTDLDGNPRPVDVVGVGFEGAAAFDMGAFEFQLPQGDLDSNGFTDPMDLFLFQRDWMKATR